jgi:hypothetical protein
LRLCFGHSSRRRRGFARIYNRLVSRGLRCFFWHGVKMKKATEDI